MLHTVARSSKPYKSHLVGLSFLVVLAVFAAAAFLVLFRGHAQLQTQVLLTGASTECSNGIDDGDVDKFIDKLDPGCHTDNSAAHSSTYDPTDTSELGTNECDDGLDNDGDGFVDFNDTDCVFPEDPTEFGREQCSDTKDNDGDGFIDWSTDPGCAGPKDTTEFSFSAQCDDGFDNDGDGLIDFRSNSTGDSGCVTVQDSDEREVITGTQRGLGNALEPNCVAKAAHDAQSQIDQGLSQVQCRGVFKTYRNDATLPCVNTSTVYQGTWKCDVTRECPWKCYL